MPALVLTLSSTMGTVLALASWLLWQDGLAAGQIWLSCCALGLLPALPGRRTRHVADRD